LKSLRSSILTIFVSLLVLTGYSSRYFCDCCADHRAELTEQGGPAPSSHDGCDCFCHQIFSDASGVPAGADTAHRVVHAAAAIPDEFPPDAMPSSIDHPPQLS
jgi:hypothetical protein